MNISKRRFLCYGMLSSTVLLFSGCELWGVTTLAHTLKVLQYDLVPKAKEMDLNVNSYIFMLLRHKRVRQSDKEFLKNGVKWLNEEAVNTYQKEYAKLAQNQRQTLLKKVSQEGWGEDFLADVMRYTFEAMLSDPVYGVNKNELAWKWLDFEGGLPRPQKGCI
ncbi:MAG: gluconate 2-dehydrogenase subunit 3 family protein [Epsilonproteobacteria bacterium]|nr:gluconate 2-dehydrogenase subunit 3 family protein [Campylobacterota bacterium]